MNLSFPAVQPGMEEPRDLAYLQQLGAQPTAATPSVASPIAAAATPATDQPVTVAQQGSVPSPAPREPSAEAPRYAGVNSMFGF